MTKTPKIALKILLLLVIALVLFRIFVTPHIVKITGGGMLPTYAEFDPYRNHFDIVLFELNKNVCVGCISVFGKDGRKNISRIVGLPHDLIKFSKKNGALNINGVPEAYEYLRDFESTESSGRGIKSYPEYAVTTGTIRHSILLYDRPSLNYKNLSMQNGNSVDPSNESCEEQINSFICPVPPNSVFVIGDNRGSSKWGMIPIDNIIGIYHPSEIKK
ncbi:signal peptidase I [Oxalobacteraceae bacterium GrIS 2.11]